jgi:hypothetical protein
MYKAYCAHPSPTYSVACSGLIALPLPLPVPYPYPYPYNQVACSDDSLEKVYRSQEVYTSAVWPAAAALWIACRASAPSEHARRAGTRRTREPSIVASHCIVHVCSLAPGTRPVGVV